MALQMLFREAGIEDCIRYRQGPHFQYPLIVGVPLQSFCLRSSSEIKKSALRFLKANFPCETLLGFGIIYQILFKQKHRNSKTIFANHGPGNPKISSTRKEPKSEKDWETRRGNQIPPCGFSVIQALDPYHTSATNCTWRSSCIVLVFLALLSVLWTRQHHCWLIAIVGNFLRW